MLTISIEVSLGTRGNVNIVLPVRFRGGVTFRARCQGRLQTTSCLALAKSPVREHRKKHPSCQKILAWLNEQRNHDMSLSCFVETKHVGMRRMWEKFRIYETYREVAISLKRFVLCFSRLNSVIFFEGLNRRLRHSYNQKNALGHCQLQRENGLAINISSLKRIRRLVGDHSVKAWISLVSGRSSGQWFSHQHYRINSWETYSLQKSLK